MIPVIVVLDCVGAFSMGFKLRASVWKAEFLPLLPFLVVGLLIGAFVLMNLSTQWLFAGLGIFVVIFGAYYTIDRKSMMRVPRWVGAPLGIVAGITSSAFGVGSQDIIKVTRVRGREAAHRRFHHVGYPDPGDATVKERLDHHLVRRRQCGVSAKACRASEVDTGDHQEVSGEGFTAYAGHGVGVCGNVAGVGAFVRKALRMQHMIWQLPGYSP